MEKGDKEKPAYFKADKFSFDELGENVPSVFIPNQKRMMEVFIWVFVLSIMISVGLVTMKMFANPTAINTEAITIGYPFAFVELGMGEADVANPIHFSGILLNLLIFFIFAYIIEIILNMITKQFSDKSQPAKLYKIREIILMPFYKEKTVQMLQKQTPQRPAAPKPNVPKPNISPGNYLPKMQK